jgi:hypothetical protein
MELASWYIESIDRKTSWLMNVSGASVSERGRAPAAAAVLLQTEKSIFITLHLPGQEL